MNSLRARLGLASLLVVTLFLGLTGLALERAWHQSAREAMQARLEARLYGLLAALEVDADGRLQVPERLPDEALSRPDSGRYAQVETPEGRILWRSPSLLEGSLAAPPVGEGERRFRPPGDEGMFLLTQGIAWEYAPGAVLHLRVSVAESAAAHRQALVAFRRSLVAGLGLAALLLVAAQWAVLAWGLSPLGRLAAELDDVRAGRREALSGGWPAELAGLAERLNAFIRAEREQRSRYRDALADLAHSLKTPLAVLRGALREGGDPEGLDAQAEEMNRIIDYQLQRAAAAGRGVLRAPIAVRPVLSRIRAGLAKVHADKALTWGLEVPEDLRCPIEEGDLFEIAGNLMENACKWASSRVRVSAEADADGWVLVVEDDGPGIPEDQAEFLLARGRRGDEQVPGQGIGLAVVADVVRAYAGELKIRRSPLGGARLEIRFPAG
ncbi:MAG TPA: histidine kinase [Rhodospirillales bacterium]|nr:histidine kinase [Rhodospirillales bacterium]